MLVNSYAFYLFINAPWFFKGKEKNIAEFLKRKEFLDNTELDSFCRKIVGVLKGVNIIPPKDYIEFANFIEHSPINIGSVTELLNEAVKELKKQTKRDECEIRKLLLKGIPPLAIVNYQKDTSNKTEYDALLYLKRIGFGIETVSDVDLVEILQSYLAKETKEGKQ